LVTKWVKYAIWAIYKLAMVVEEAWMDGDSGLGDVGGCKGDGAHDGVRVLIVESAKDSDDGKSGGSADNVVEISGIDSNRESG
jgi:hypothetical protein